LSILTLGLVASLVTMFVMQGGLDEIWVYASLALYGMALLVYWLITAGSKPQLTQGKDDVAAKVAAALAAGAPRAPAVMSEPEPELVVEPSRTEPIVLPTPLEPTPSAYTFRGFTLYERGTSRFFSKSSPPGAQAIELPEGYEAKWDDKKEKPVLIEVLQEEPETPDVTVVSQQKPCSAMIAPGEFCENLAKDGSKYCGRHVNFDREEEIFEVRKSGSPKAAKGPRFATPQIDVRYARPSPKPFKIKPAKPAAIEVRVAKPSNTKELEYKRGKPIEVKAPRAASKPFKPRGSSEIVVEHDAPEHMKPLKFGRANEPMVRVAKPPAPKPLHLRAAAEPTIKVDHALPTKGKGKGLAHSDVVLRKGAFSKPVPKGKQLSMSEIVVKKPASPASQAKGKQLPASEIVLKQPHAGKPAPKGKQLPASEIVVKKPGTAKPVAPLKFAKDDFVVRSTRDARAPAKLPKIVEPDIVVVKDTKRRSTLGIGGEAPKKRK
jgi:hypothetical protein